MQMQTISKSARIRIFAGSVDVTLLVCGMHWCLNDTNRLCGERKL
jgi:hypothetical protein